MQCSLDKHGACFCYQEGDLFFWNGVAPVQVLLVVPIPLQEAFQQEAAVHVVPLQELVLTLEALEQVPGLLLELVQDFLQVDLWATKKVIVGLHRKGVERNQRLEVDLAIPYSRSKVERRLPVRWLGELVSLIIEFMNQSCQLALHRLMEPLNRVPFWVIHRSGSGSDVKSCHCDLKDVRNVRRTIVRMDTPIRKVILVQVFDYCFGLLVLNWPSSKPSGIDVNYGVSNLYS